MDDLQPLKVIALHGAIPICYAIMTYRWFLIGAACFFVAGCTTQDPNLRVMRRAGLSEVKIGMTMSQVQALIGSPIRTNQTVTITGVQEQHIYTGSQFRTPGESFAFGMAEGPDANPAHPTYYIYYERGRVTRIAIQGSNMGFARSPTHA